MEIVRDDLWLCTDCTVYACNGDLSGIGDETRAAAVQEGVDAFGPNLVNDSDVETGEGYREFAWKTCAACGSRLGGECHRFAVLGDP